MYTIIIIIIITVFVCVSVIMRKVYTERARVVLCARLWVGGRAGQGHTKEAGGRSPRLAHGARSAAAVAWFFTHLPGADNRTQYEHSVRTAPHEIALCANPSPLLQF